MTYFKIESCSRSRLLRSLVEHCQVQHKSTNDMLFLMQFARLCGCSVSPSAGLSVQLPAASKFVGKLMSIPVSFAADLMTRE